MCANMDRAEFLKLLKDKVLVLDGAMGTMLHKLGFTKGCPDELNLKNPELIKSIHKSYADAGANIIITNTFGANRLKLNEYGLGEKTTEINKAAVKNAREAAPNCLIAGDIGPLGKDIEPLDNITFDQAHEIFSEQVRGLKDADLLIIETISDIKVLKAAILAAKDNSNLPVIASMTFQEGRTSTGTDVETYTSIADSFDVDAIGVNCSDGPEGLLEVAKTIVKNTNKPIVVQPNAGIPRIVNKRTVFTQTPKDFAKYTREFHKIGVNILGGCCGTDHRHIKEIAGELKELKPVKRDVKEKTKLCSRTKTLTIEEKTLVVGERINPTGKKDFQEEIKKSKTNYIRDQALLQVDEGAALLDINVGVAGTDEIKMLQKAVQIVQKVADVPIVIDTANSKALELALKQSNGKPLINSINGSEKSLKQVLPLAKRYGAAIIALTLDEEGIPKTKEKRIEIAKRIIDEAKTIGIKKQDIIVDCVTLTIATNPENENILLDSVKEIKKQGYKTILGISNISHGLPNRSEINSKFLTKAIKAGLDLAIINPLDNILQENTDIQIFRKKEFSIDQYKEQRIEEQIYDAILYGDEDNIIEILEKGLKKLEALEINEILVDALSEVGYKFNKKIYFLPQVLASANAMKKAFSRLKEELKKENGKQKGIVMFATVENDFHDIGKNIVIALLESNNYRIIDLGKNVPKEKIAEAVKEYNPDLIGLSALMTTTVMEMEGVIKKLRKERIKTPVIIGGAVVTDDYAKQIKAAYSKDALGAVKKINEMIRGIKEKEKITDILKEKDFTVSVELVPPRNGTTPERIMEKIRKLKGKVDFVSVTKGAGGSLRGGTLPISVYAQEKQGINTISHFVCRERTKVEIENDLMDLYYFRIKNILALRGDPPAGAKDSKLDSDYKYAYQLVEQIKNMNNGKYLPRKGFDKDFREGIKTNFCIIVAGHPEDPLEKEVEHVKEKVEAGAEVIITQMIFSFEEYKQYVEALKKSGIKIPVIAGIRPLTSKKQADSVEEFFNLKVNDKLKKGLSEAKTEKEAEEFGLNYTADMIKKLKAYKAPGAHFFVLDNIELVYQLLERI